MSAFGFSSLQRCSIVSMVMIEQHAQNQLGEERIYIIHSLSLRDFSVEFKQKKNLEAGAETMAMGVLPSGLIFMACSACFYKSLRTSIPMHSDLGPSNNHQSKKLPIGMCACQSTGNIFSLESPF